MSQNTIYNEGSWYDPHEWDHNLSNGSTMAFADNGKPTEGLVIDGKGNKLWFANGRLHRENGPAVEWINGCTEWWYNGKFLGTPDGDEQCFWNLWGNLVGVLNEEQKTNATWMLARYAPWLKNVSQESKSDLKESHMHSSFQDKMHNYVPAFVIANSFAILINTLVILFAFGGKESASDSSSGEVAAEAQTPQVTNTPLNCYPVFNEKQRGESFSCDGQNYIITSYEAEYAEEALGGRFPRTKTLEQLGCKLQGETLLCREENIFKAKGVELRAYREIVAAAVPAEI